MRFHCPHCKQKLVGNPVMVGRQVPCPNCNRTLTVPGEPEPAPAAADAKPAAERAPSGPGAKPRPRARGKPSVDPTNVSLPVSGLIGLGLTLAFYLLILPFKGGYFYALFYQRGWIPPVEALLMFWSVGFLFLKWQRVKMQQRGMLFDLLPEDLGSDITAQNVDRFLEHIEGLPVKAHESFLIARVLRVLDHFRVRDSNPEAASVMSSQSDIDANTMQASYTILKAFIWAIPILGFIGTVQGLGSAVGGFSAGLGKAQDLAVLKDSLSTITVGLAVAFDTTLIALVMSVLLMFPMSQLQKAEEDLISRIDDYCNENLLKRLKESGGTAAPGGAAPGLAAALREALAAQLGSLQQMAALFDGAGLRVAREFGEGAQRLQAVWQAQREQELKAFGAVLQAAAERQAKALEAATAAHGQIAAQAQAGAQGFGELSARLEAGVGALNEAVQKAVADAGLRHEAAERTVAGSVADSTAALRKLFEALHEDLRAVSETLARLEAKGLAPRRGWRLFRRG